MTGTRIVNADPYANREEKQVVIYDTESLTPEGRLAVCLVEKWGIVAAISDGEDSTGRQKLRIQTPDELAERACEVSKKLYEAMRNQGMTISVPDLNEVNNSENN